MIFGILKDIKDGENRVICTPIEVKSIVADGHTVLAEHNCGLGSGFTDEKYVDAGAQIVMTAAELYKRCDMVAKVKEFEKN
jgi:alanine dehydrogenase